MKPAQTSPVPLASDGDGRRSFGGLGPAPPATPQVDGAGAATLAPIVVRDFLATGVVGVLLMAPAAAVRWPGAWAFLIEMALLSVCLDIWLRLRDPGLHQARTASPSALQPAWDRWVLMTYFTLWIAWFVVMGFDVRLHGVHRTLGWAEAAGAIGVAAYYALTFSAFRSNTFAAPIVTFQPERGHHVISDGPYRIIRHPMYAASVLLFVSAPLLLGAPWGLAFAPILTGVLVLRCLLEERTLRGGLEGYEAYLMRVRYRLVPLVW